MSQPELEARSACVADCSPGALHFPGPPSPRTTGRVTAVTRPAPGPPPGLVLRWTDPAGESRARPLRGPSLGIGAHPDNAVALDDRFVSSFHCVLREADGVWRVKDLGSTNGTFVDGMRVLEAEVPEGSRLSVGGFELRLEGPAPLPLAVIPGFLTRDPSLGPALDLLRRAAPTHVPVLLLGESGTGKEIAARGVHDLSRRSGGPFVPVNCGAIPQDLAESELFGYEKGAFTGAVASSPGAFGAADGGTLFLDEIGELPIHLQVKLLRALECGEIKPLGAPRPRRVDVRLIAATHRDLAALVRTGAFREDLFFRLRGATVTLSPLRARPVDILPLAEHFLRCVGGQRLLSPCARAALVSHRWPGNVRELRQVIQLAAVLSDGPAVRAEALGLGPASVGPEVEGPPEPGARSGPPVAAPPAEPPREAATLARMEEHAIRAAWARNDGNRRATARELGIARSSLLRKLDRLGLR